MSQLQKHLAIAHGAPGDFLGSAMTRYEEDQAINVVALVARSELNKLGPAFDRAWPVNHTSGFGELLAAIDEAMTAAGEARFKKIVHRPQ